MRSGDRSSDQAGGVTAGVRVFVLAVLLVLLVPPAADARGLSRDPLRRALADEARRLGPHSGLYARDLRSGTVLISRRANRPLIPASTDKLWTTAAVLERLGPRRRLVTRVLAAARPDRRGRLAGNLWLVGGGDPSLSSADLAGLAAQIRALGVRRLEGRVIADDSRLDPLRGSPSTAFAPDGWLGGQLGGLTVDGGVSGPHGPAGAAGRALRSALRHAGVRVRRRSVLGRAPAWAQPVAAHRSAPLAQLVAHTNQASDNFYAEMLLKRLSADGSSDAGLQVVDRTASRLGLHPRLADGSGLSRANRSSARQLTRLLVAMRKGRLRRAWTASLAVAGRSGTLAGRLRRTRAAGRCRAKTGTLSDVSSLAGYCQAAGRTPIVFALIANRVDVSRAKAVEDRILALLAGYRSDRVILARALRTRGCVGARSVLWNRPDPAVWLACLGARPPWPFSDRSRQSPAVRPAPAA